MSLLSDLFGARGKRESQPLQTRVLKILGLGLALVLGAAELRFIFARPLSETRYPRLALDPPGRFNLAAPALGVTVRASSVNWSRRHHPAYVLAGRVGTKAEKWASAKGDPSPWIEVEFDRPRHVDGVNLALAGVLERPELTMRDYSLECFGGTHVLASSVVRENRDARPHVALACEGATKVRVTFPTEPTEPRDVVRLYGLEIWGSS